MFNSSESNEIYKEKVNHVKDIIRTYFYLKSVIVSLEEQNKELMQKLDDETSAHSIPYDKVSSGVSVVNTTPYITELIYKQAGVEQDLVKTKKKLEHFARDFEIDKMLNSLSKEEISYILLLFDKKVGIHTVSKIKKCSIQYVHKRLDRIISKMIRQVN